MANTPLPSTSSGSSRGAANPPKFKLPWRVRLSIAFLSAVTNASKRANGTINRRLISMVEMIAPPNPVPVRGVRTLDLTIDPSRNLWIRLFIPSSSDPAAALPKLPIVIFFHGGGFAFLSPDNSYYDLTCRRLARKIPALIASVNYRLSPENRFPAPYDDGIDVLRFIDSGGIDSVSGGNFVDLSSCFLAGDSAGANIAHHVTRRWARSNNCEGNGRVGLLGLVLIQPFFGGQERTESEMELTGAPLVSIERTDWLWKAFLPKGADRDHEAANVFGPNDSEEIEEGYPPVLLVIGGGDPLQDWQRKYRTRLSNMGKEVRLLDFPGAIHAFYIFPGMPDGAKLVEEIGSFIRSRSTPERSATD